MNDRLRLIKELFNLQSDIKALQYSEFVKGIPSGELIKFSTYALQNAREYETQDKFVARTAKEFLAHLNLIALQKRAFRFESIDAMISFVRENFKGKELTNGEPKSEKGKGNGFMPYVVLGIDKDGDLFSRYQMRKVTDCEAEFYGWLFENQHKIGVVKLISEAEYFNAIAKKDETKLVNSEQSKPNANLFSADPKMTNFNKMVKSVAMGERK